MDEFKKNYLFTLYKDTPLDSAKEFRSKILKKYGTGDTRDLYSRICNYQIDKYGAILEPDYVDLSRYKKHKDNDRRNNRRKRRGLKKYEN